MSNPLANLDPPDKKVTVGAVAAAVAVLVSWLVETFTGVSIPVGVEGSIATIVYFIASYIVPLPKQSPLPSPEQSPPDQTAGS